MLNLRIRVMNLFNLTINLPTLNPMTLGSGRVRLVRYSSLLIMCCNCRRMNTHPRNLDVGVITSYHQTSH